MGGLAHRRLAELPILHKATSLIDLSFGETRVLIASEPDVARDILTSSSCADRPLKQSSQQLLFGRAIGFALYSDYWRNLRRIVANHLFAPKRIAAHEKARLAEVEVMLNAIESEVAATGRVMFDEHRAQKVAHAGESYETDFIDVLLGLDGEEKLADEDMIAVLWISLTNCLMRSF